MPRLKYYNTKTNTWEYVGANGADGKSAYEYAKDAGFTGTEAEFAQKLIEDNAVKTIPQELTDEQKQQAQINIGIEIATDEEIIEMLGAENIDMLPVVTDADGAILTDENENILMW